MYMIYILLITFLKSLKSFFCAQLNGFKYCYVSPTPQLNISHLFTYNQMIKQFYL